MPASRSAQVEPTLVHRIYDVLVHRDDFVRLEDLVEATKIPRGQVIRTLWYLRKVHAVDSVESAGTLWWFSTPDTDSRRMTFDQRKKEDEPRVYKGRRITRKAPKA